jgi:hypothetical protein
MKIRAFIPASCAVIVTLSAGAWAQVPQRTPRDMGCGNPQQTYGVPSCAERDARLAREAEAERARISAAEAAERSRIAAEAAQAERSRLAAESAERARVEAAERERAAEAARAAQAENARMERECSDEHAPRRVRNGAACLAWRTQRAQAEAARQAEAEAAARAEEVRRSAELTRRKQLLPGAQFVVIPAGRFQMGSPDSEAGR